jgi:acyl-CoA hydrolase
MAINYISPQEAALLIKSDSNIFIQGSTSLPNRMIDAIFARHNEVHNVNLYVGFSVTSRPIPFTPEIKDSFNLKTFFVSSPIRQWISDGYGSMIPQFLGDTPTLFRENVCPIDLAFVYCTPPDKDGYVSLGISSEFPTSIVKWAKKIVAIENSYMPYTLGDTVIHTSRIEALVQENQPLAQVICPEPTAEEIKIGEYLAEQIPDGATLQIGIGSIPNSVAKALGNHKNLGLHTEVLTDGVLPLLENGVINNSQKKIKPGKSTTCFSFGSQRLYDFLDHNPDIIFKDVTWTNDPYRIGQNPKAVSINSCLEVDLTGQVCADSIGTKIYSGVGGQHDFVYGASRSEGGLSFLAMLSKTAKGISKIKATLTDGAGVVTTRYQTNFIVTEYGAVDLRGKNLIQRAKLMISIAAPEFREELDRAARERFGYAYTRFK